MFKQRRLGLSLMVFLITPCKEQLPVRASSVQLTAVLYASAFGRALIFTKRLFFEMRILASNSIGSKNSRFLFKYAPPSI